MSLVTSMTNLPRNNSDEVSSMSSFSSSSIFLGTSCANEVMGAGNFQPRPVMLHESNSDQDQLIYSSFCLLDHCPPSPSERAIPDSPAEVAPRASARFPSAGLASFLFIAGIPHGSQCTLPLATHSLID